MQKIKPITRKFMVMVANASESKNHPEVLAFIEKMELAGIDTDASSDDMEEYDLLDDKLNYIS